MNIINYLSPKKDLHDIYYNNAYCNCSKSKYNDLDLVFADLNNKERIMLLFLALSHFENVDLSKMSDNNLQYIIKVLEAN